MKMPRVEVLPSAMRYLWALLQAKLAVMRRPSRAAGFHAYWLSPEQRNMPQRYISVGHKRSRHLVETVSRHFDKRTAIFEIGCNAGRNLHYLFAAGFSNLHGLELNPKAVALLREVYPELAEVPVHVSAVENKIRDYPTDRFGLTFTMAVLEHVHKQSEWVFAEIGRISQNVLTIEDERSESSRTFPRSYRKVFERLGLRQVEEERNLPDLSDAFVLRLFRK